MTGNLFSISRVDRVPNSHCGQEAGMRLNGQTTGAHHLERHPAQGVAGPEGGCEVVLPVR